jgi:trk system potassium uptake protein TrkA
MFVFIAGGELTGAELASGLLARDHQVRLMEHRPAVLERIHRELPTEAVIEGNVTDPHALESAGIGQAQVMVAFTTHDATNLVLCYVAHTLYHVPRTIAVINDPRNAWLFDQKFYVDVALDTSEILAHFIEEEMSLGDMMTLLKLRKGEYSLVEEKVHPASVAAGKPVRALDLPPDCTLVAIIRSGELIVPHGDTVLEPADEVLAVVRQSQLAQLNAQLAPASR